VKRAGHDSVGGVEGLLNPIPMMNIDINIQDALMKSRYTEFEANA
jgi:hypothetical protein